jgi:hypothetical protein
MRQVPAWNTVRAPRTVEPWSWCAWLALVIWLLVRAFNQFVGLRPVAGLPARMPAAHARKGARSGGPLAA